MKNMHKVGNKSENTYEGKKAFERQKTWFICKFWSISMLLDLDPHSQYGPRSGSTTPAKSMPYSQIGRKRMFLIKLHLFYVVWI
jgi:hypothetical protein